MGQDISHFKQVVEEQASNLSDTLYKLAMLDEKMSDDEEEIVNAVIYNLHELRQYVIFACDDEKITKEEKKQLSRLTAKLVTSSHEIAFTDNNLTTDESSLLNAVKITVIELQELVYNLELQNEDN